MSKSKKSVIAMCSSLSIWSALVLVAVVCLGQEAAAGLYCWFSRCFWPGFLGLIVCSVVAASLQKRYRGGSLLEFLGALFIVCFGLMLFGLASWLACLLLTLVS